MKTSSKLHLAALFTSITLLSSAFAAEQSPSDAPPKMDITNNDESAVKPGKSESTHQKIQTIQNGQQTEIHVTNKAGTYIVKPNRSVGTSLPGDAQSSSNHAAQWVVKGWGEKNNKPTTPPPTLKAKPKANAATPDSPTVTTPTN